MYKYWYFLRIFIRINYMKRYLLRYLTHFFPHISLELIRVRNTYPTCYQQLDYALRD